MTGVALTDAQIPVARMLVLKAALKLECLGMKRRGRSVYSIVKEEFSLRGSKASVLAQFTSLCETAKGGS